MKGINNRQKTIVRPRETVQKFIVQQKRIRKGKAQIQREGIEDKRQMNQ
jgi:hypothetical protein